MPNYLLGSDLGEIGAVVVRYYGGILPERVVYSKPMEKPHLNQLGV